MADTDSGTIAAWVAFAVALFALVIALAQVVQQYLATAQNMRKCDKSVWGPMPGHSGRRIWIWHQLRFRIVFDMPNIFIPTEYWDVPGSARLFPVKRISILPSPFDDPSTDLDPEAAVQQSSEACWVSFARQVSHICPTAIRVGLMKGDIDRLPADLPVVPMQVSTRDIVALGLMIGMTITSPHGGTLEMSGPSGFIKSSDHPLLGRLIHFSAFSMAPRSFHKGLRSRDLSKSWLHRLKGIATVATKPYTDKKRQYYEQIGKRWRDSRTRYLLPAGENMPFDAEALEGVHVVFAIGVDGNDKHSVPIDKCQTWEATQAFLESENLATAPYIIIGPENKPVPPKSWKALMKVVGQGNLNSVFRIAKGDYISEDLSASVDKDGQPMSALDRLIRTSVNPGPKSNTPPLGSDDPEKSISAADAALKRGNDGNILPGVTGQADEVTADLSQNNEPISHAHPPEKLTKPPRPYVRDVTDQSLTLIKWNGRNGRNERNLEIDEEESGDDQEPDDPDTQFHMLPRSRYSRHRRPPPPRPPPTHPSPPSPISVDDDYPGYRHRYSRPPRPPPPRNHPSPPSSIINAPISVDDDYPGYRHRYPQPRHRETGYPTWSSPLHWTDPPKLTFFWACQVDIELGSWATPWKGGIFGFAQQALDMVVEICLLGLAVCNQKAAVELKQIQSDIGPRLGVSEGDLRSAGVQFASFPADLTLSELWHHLRDGKHTWPPHAINGHDGTLEPTPHRRINFPTFPDDQRLPPLLLLHSVYHDLTNTVPKSQAYTHTAVEQHLHLARDRLLELAALDHWLSHAATTPSILGSLTNLLDSTPGIVEEIWLGHQYDIMETQEEDKWNRDGGGFDQTQRIAGKIQKFLDLELKTHAERFYVWVAFLRAVKVLLCVSQGPETAMVTHLFDDDVLVYLA